jgi:hypothetical protein
MRSWASVAPRNSSRFTAVPRSTRWGRPGVVNGVDEVEHEPIGDVERLDEAGLAALEARRVTDDHLRQAGVAWIAHGHLRKKGDAERTTSRAG